ncbi:MAG: spinster family MFS transporter [Gemmatimonadaceae bacterium]
MRTDDIAASYPRPRYAWYVVGVLTLAYVSSLIDRQIVNLLVAPIRRDLGISDTQISLLMGLSFAVFYTLLGLPIGRLADAHSRRGIMAWGVAVWSIMTALCGLARTFGQFFMARVGVGVGEAALSPSAYSLLTDCFPKERLSTALSVYSSGIYVGGGLALIIGGLVINAVGVAGSWTLPIVGDVPPWRSVFFIVGLPGLLIALLFLTVREPARRGATALPVPMAEVARYVRDNLRTFGGHHVGMACISLAAYAANSWIPSVFVRSYGWSLPRIGLVYGMTIMCCGTLGVLAGGHHADRGLRQGRLDAKFRTCLVSAVGMLACAVLLGVAPNALIAAVCVAPLTFFQAFAYGAAAAAVQELTPNRMRAQVSAFYLLVVNIIGLGLGPTAVALLTDYVFHDDAAVRASLTTVIVASLVMAILLLRYGRRGYAHTIGYRDQWLARNTIVPAP